MSLNQTPSANRVHIGIFGKRNSGKSSLINALTGQESALVSPVAGTTTDPVSKAMEIHGIGPCLLIDTAGFDDFGQLGEMRVQKTKEVLLKIDLAILVISDEQLEMEQKWVESLKKRKTPILFILNKINSLMNAEYLHSKIREVLQAEALKITTYTQEELSNVKNAIIALLPEDYEAKSITSHLVSPLDTVLLVMPQDLQAPKGRLILPQVQTIRDLLDNQCLVMCTTTDHMENALLNLKNPPKLIITDSQAFKKVYAKKPKESLLTSFSILFAAYKGDLKEFVQGAKALNHLTEQSKVLIAEACTHAPLSEDIGREKIPRMLRHQIGQGLQIDHVSGSDFPKDVSSYHLIIHCGACMFNRKHVLARIATAKQQGVPISNYGVVLAQLTGILDEISLEATF